MLPYIRVARRGFGLEAARQYLPDKQRATVGEHAPVPGYPLRGLLSGLGFNMTTGNLCSLSGLGGMRATCRSPRRCGPATVEGQCWIWRTT